MNDPHVERLVYRFKVIEPNTSFKNPPAVSYENDVFKATLAENRLVLEMKEHFATEDAAHAAVRPRLRAWEMDAGLRLGAGEFSFDFENAQVIDRKPDPGSAHVLAAAVTARATATGSLTVRVERARSPDPPDPTFKITPDVETLWARYEGYRRGREPLTAMAYFCLTVLEWIAAPDDKNKRARGCSHFGIARDVRDKLGDLSSEVGTGESARKYSGKGRPHTSAEEEWLRVCVRALIRRVGEVAANGSAAGLPEITMASLPKL